MAGNMALVGQATNLIIKERHNISDTECFFVLENERSIARG